MNSFGTLQTLTVGGREVQFHSLSHLQEQGHKISHLPFSLRILLENLLRTEDGISVTKGTIESLLRWNPNAEPSEEISFTPARVLLQDFTGVPCVVDLAAMRDAMAEAGGDPKKINPLQPVELVIDHSVQVDAYGSDAAIMINRDLEYERNEERYAFLRWGQQAFQNFKVVPPNTGIVHQVNLEYLARVVMTNDAGMAYPDTLVGTDSHTTMINGLGVLGWGVGGIEAEAAMLGQPVSMLIPQVIGFRLIGSMSKVASATDLVLTVTEMLRKRGVVGKFVEFFGPGLKSLSLADRATIGNMAPEYGATCGIFPVDEQTLRYLRLTGRSDEQVALVEAYMRAQGLFHDDETGEGTYTDVLELDLSTVEPSVAGPKRPQDRVALSQARDTLWSAFPAAFPGRAPATGGGIAVKANKTLTEGLEHGDIVIAAITSCTNTSNPSVMVAAGLLAKKAVERGLKSKPWVKTSLAPGSRVVSDYLEVSGLQEYLNDLGFNVVGYGCTTCIGNSGPLPESISKQIIDNDLVSVSVLSGNRNFEGRINQEVKANYLMSPPLVVAYALAGSLNVDLNKDPLGTDQDGRPVYLHDLWPSRDEIAEVVHQSINADMFRRNYANVFEGDEKWKSMPTPESDRFTWDPHSTYVKRAPYFDGMPREAPEGLEDPKNMMVLAILGDSITTDHISPAGSIKAKSPAGEYLMEHDVRPHLFNSYGSRRGNHEVMVRGTFANVRLRNKLAPGTEGGFTTDLLTGKVTTIFEASEHYRNKGIGLVILAGKEYGSGSSRDWAAKGPHLLGVKAVIAESYERIHRSNLIGMGILPLQFVAGQSAESLGLTGLELYTVDGVAGAYKSGELCGKQVEVTALRSDGSTVLFPAKVRIDAPKEAEYYRHGGILQYVLRQLLSDS